MVAASVRDWAVNRIHPVSHCLDICLHGLLPLTVAVGLKSSPALFGEAVDKFRHFGQFASIIFYAFAMLRAALGSSAGPAGSIATTAAGSFTRSASP